MPALLAVLIIVPLVELFILIEVGQVIGALATIALCVLTALIGGALLRQQGLQTLNRARANLDRGAVPALELAEGVALALGGVMLLTPGFATDVIGFACLIPATRRVLVHALLRKVQVRYGPVDGGGRAGPRPQERDVIEGEFRRRERPPGRDD